MNELIIQQAVQGAAADAMMEAALRSELAMRMYVAAWEAYCHDMLGADEVDPWEEQEHADAAVRRADLLIAALRRPPAARS